MIGEQVKADLTLAESYPGIQHCHIILFYMQQINEAPTCSACSQEGDGQMSGQSFTVLTRKTAQEGLKLPIGTR